MYTSIIPCTVTIIPTIAVTLHQLLLLCNALPESQSIIRLSSNCSNIFLSRTHERARAHTHTHTHTHRPQVVLPHGQPVPPRHVPVLLLRRHAVIAAAIRHAVIAARFAMLLLRSRLVFVWVLLLLLFLLLLLLLLLLLSSSSVKLIMLSLVVV